MLSGCRALGRALGVSAVVASGYTRRPDWPFGKGPWHEGKVPAMKEWRKTNLSPNPAKPGTTSADADEADDTPAGGDTLEALRQASPERRAKLALTLTRTKKLQAELEQFLGDYIRKDEVERGRVERVTAVQQGLRNLVHTLAPKLVGLDAVGIEGVLEVEFREMCNRFANG